MENLNHKDGKQQSHQGEPASSGSDLAAEAAKNRDGNINYDENLKLEKRPDDIENAMGDDERIGNEGL